MVCKRWAAVVWSTPALWRQLTIHAGPRLVAAPASVPGWAAAKQALLRRVAPLLESLQLSTCGPGGASGAGPTATQCRLAAAYVCGFLSSLAAAAQLTEIQLNVWGLALGPTYVRTLAGLPRLHSLAIQWPEEFALDPSPGRCVLISGNAGWDLAAAVAQMSCLQRLALPAASVPAPLLSAIAGLARLSSLTLSSQQPLPAVVAGLAAAPALKELRLHEKEARDAGGLPLPGATSQLTMLHVAAPCIQVGVCLC